MTDPELTDRLENVLAINPNNAAEQRRLQESRKRRSPGLDSTPDAETRSHREEVVLESVMETGKAIKSQPGSRSHMPRQDAKQREIGSRNERETSMQTQSTAPRTTKQRWLSAFTRALLYVLLCTIVLLQLADLSTRIIPIFGYETMTAPCQSVGSYSPQGWRVVAAYSYSLGGAYTGYMVYNDCVLERPKPLFAR